MCTSTKLAKALHHLNNARFELEVVGLDAWHNYSSPISRPMWGQEVSHSYFILVRRLACLVLPAKCFHLSLQLPNHTLLLIVRHLFPAIITTRTFNFRVQRN